MMSQAWPQLVSNSCSRLRIRRKNLSTSRFRMFRSKNPSMSPTYGGTCIWKMRARDFFPLAMCAGCPQRRPHLKFFTCEQAAELPSDAARDALLKKAEQADTASHLEINSPG